MSFMGQACNHQGLYGHLFLTQSHNLTSRIGILATVKNSAINILGTLQCGFLIGNFITSLSLKVV